MGFPVGALAKAAVTRVLCNTFKGGHGDFMRSTVVIAGMGKSRVISAFVTRVVAQDGEALVEALW